jgi:HAE1 family hydrophobic/amphiphilic exporter-1
VSLTLTPMLCARVLHTHKEGERQNFVLRAFEAMFKSWLQAYEWSLDWVIRFKAIMLAVTFGTLIATVWLYIIIGFLPDGGYQLHCCRD